MRTSNDSCTIFEFIANKLNSLENSFSELVTFAASDKNAIPLFYDQVAHRFKAQGESTQLKKRDFLSELKFSLEDMTNYPKTTFKLLHHLIGELNFEEAAKTNAALSRLAIGIKEAHDHILNYINGNEIPSVFKQEMLYHIGQMKNLMREAQILEVETSPAKSEGFSEGLTAGGGGQLTAKTAEVVLKKITADVDQMILRMPFVVPEEERSRLIGERFKAQLEKLE